MAQQLNDDDEDLKSAEPAASGDEDSAEAEEAGAPTDDTEDLAKSAATEQQNETTDTAPAVPAWKDYLTKKMKLDQGVKDARANAQDKNSTTNIFQALGGMFGGKANMDNGFYDKLRGQNDQKVAQSMQDRQQSLQDYLTGRSLSRQDTADAREATKFGQEQTDWGFKNAQNTRTQKQQAAEDAPDSAESDYARKIADRLDPKTDHSSLSATQIKAQLPMVKDIFDQSMKQQDLQLRFAQMNDSRQWNKDYKNAQLNGGFAKGFNNEENKYQAASGKIDETLNMVDQATNQGGVTSRLVPLEVARQIAGRLNPQEIAAAGGDPSIAGKLERLISTASEGKMDGVDAEQFRALLQSQKDTLTAVREKQRTQNIGAWAKSTGQDPAQVRAMVLGAQPDAKTPSAAPSTGAAGGLPPKAGFTVMTSPSGKPGYIPNDKVDDAKKANFK